MSILNKYKRWVTQLTLLTDKWWDVVLSMDHSPSEYTDGRMTTDCLSSYIDMSDRLCIEEDGVVSNQHYVYGKGYNEGYDLMDIGFTGIDNGFIKYDRREITNRQFFEIFANTRITVDSGDTRLHLHSVTGNTGVYSYDKEYVDNAYYALKGGFFQGFYKLHGFNYEVLPQNIEDSWHVELVLRPQEYEEKANTLNSTHPQNKGIFFYIGTRAENKFLQFYNTDISSYAEREQEHKGWDDCVYDDGYFLTEEVKPDICEPILDLYGDDSCEPLMPEPEKKCCTCGNDGVEPVLDIYGDDTCEDSGACSDYIANIYKRELKGCNKLRDGSANENYLKFFLTAYGWNEESRCTAEKGGCKDDGQCGCGCTDEPEEPKCDCGGTGTGASDKPEDRKSFNKRKASLLAYFLNIYGYREYSQCRPCRKIEIAKPENECDSYFRDEYFADCDGGSFLSQFEEGYFEQPISLSGVTVETSNGHRIHETGYYEIETDNKFITHNRTRTGFTVNTWEDDVKFVLTGITRNDRQNLFVTVNRTKTGHTVDSLESYYESSKPEYDFLSDIEDNCFALKANEDGSISYRYLVKSCDTDTGWDILEESTLPDLLRKGEWANVNVRFAILNGIVDACGVPLYRRKMRIYIYVNGGLKFVSRELPEFRFRELNDTFEKQEGVPFNISIGGGTQGLCDSVWLDYYKAFEKVLPVEEMFAGTFNGDIACFRFYTCPISYTSVKNNYLYDRHRLASLVTPDKQVNISIYN